MFRPETRRPAAARLFRYVARLIGRGEKGSHKERVQRFDGSVAFSR